MRTDGHDNNRTNVRDAHEQRPGPPEFFTAGTLAVPVDSRRKAVSLAAHPGWGPSEQVAQSSWRSEGLPNVLRGEVKAGCLDKPLGALGGPSERHRYYSNQSVWRRLPARSSLLRRLVRRPVGLRRRAAICTQAGVVTFVPLVQRLPRVFCPVCLRIESCHFQSTTSMSSLL